MPLQQKKDMKEQAPPDLPDKIAQSLATLAHSDPRHVESKHPQEAARALEMLSQGASLASIEQVTGLSITSISRMRRSHAEVLGEMRSRAAVDAAQTAEAYRLLMNAKAEALASNPEQLAKTNPQQLAVAYGVATDKWTALSGGPTAIVEHRRAEPTFADAQALIRQAQARVIDVEDGDPAAKSLPTNENEAK